ncbi:MAG: hypothetical protein N2593_01390 [Patescibacteria group bacterium]|nr:hypothetical protein [Patescibacteria group bacterium]
MINILIIVNLLMFLIFFLRLNLFPPQIPLFYTKPEGELQIAESWMIFLIPFLLNLFFFINNYILNNFFLNEELPIRKIFFYLNLFLIIGFFLIFIKIIFLIT